MVSESYTFIYVLALVKNRIDEILVKMTGHPCDLL